MCRWCVLCRCVGRLGLLEYHICRHNSGDCVSIVCRWLRLNQYVACLSCVLGLQLNHCSVGCAVEASDWHDSAELTTSYDKRLSCNPPNRCCCHRRLLVRSPSDVGHYAISPSQSFHWPTLSVNNNNIIIIRFVKRQNVKRLPWRTD